MSLVGNAGEKKQIWMTQIQTWKETAHVKLDEY